MADDIKANGCAADLPRVVKGHVTPKPVAPRPAPARKVKVFTVEMNSQMEGSIPAGWVPFHATATGGHIPLVLIYAYKQ